MRTLTIARSYAATLFALGCKHDAVEAFGGALEDFVRLLDEVPQLGPFLETPRIGVAEKKRVLREALEGKVPKLFLNFLLITVDKRRQGLLREVAAAYRQLLDEHLGRERVQVVVARPVDEAWKEEVVRRLSRLRGKTVIPDVRVRPQILGGIIVRAGDRILDGSLRRQLEELRRRLIRAPIPARTAG